MKIGSHRLKKDNLSQCEQVCPTNNVYYEVVTLGQHDGHKRQEQLTVIEAAHSLTIPGGHAGPSLEVKWPEDASREWPTLIKQALEDGIHEEGNAVYIFIH